MTSFKLLYSDRTKSGLKLRTVVHKCCNAVLKSENYANPCEVSVTLVGSKEIRALNRQYRGIDRATDVLSFEMDAFMLGDIIISLETAENQAKEYGHSLEREIGFLTVHGMLHLLGYDHLNKSDEDIMFAKQEEILQKLGIKR
jgi:probable rRNA maturation factor